MHAACLNLVYQGKQILSFLGLQYQVESLDEQQLIHFEVVRQLDVLNCG